MRYRFLPLFLDFLDTFSPSLCCSENEQFTEEKQLLLATLTALPPLASSSSAAAAAGAAGGSFAGAEAEFVPIESAPGAAAAGAVADEYPVPPTGSEVPTDVPGPDDRTP